MDPWIVISLGLTVIAIVVAGDRHPQRARPDPIAGRDPAPSGRRGRSATTTIAQAAAEQASLLQALGSGIVRVDRGLRVIAANAAAHTLLGRAPGTLVGRSVMEAFLDASVESMAQAALARARHARSSAGPMPMGRR